MAFYCKRYWWNTDRPINLDDPVERNWHPLDLLDVIAKESCAKAVFQLCKKSFLWFERPLERPVELNIGFYKKDGTSWDFTGPDAIKAGQMLETCILFALADNTAVLHFLECEYLKSSDGWMDISSMAKERGYNPKLLRTYEMCLSDCRESGLSYALAFGHDLDQIDYFDLTRLE